MTLERIAELRESSNRVGIYSSPIGLFGSYLIECLDEIESLNKSLDLTRKEIERLRNIIAIQQKQIERMMEVRDAEMVKCGEIAKDLEKADTLLKALEKQAADFWAKDKP